MMSESHGAGRLNSSESQAYGDFWRECTWHFVSKCKSPYRCQRQIFRGKQGSFQRIYSGFPDNAGQCQSRSQVSTQLSNVHIREHIMILRIIPAADKLFSTLSADKHFRTLNLLWSWSSMNWQKLKPFSNKFDLTFLVPGLRFSAFRLYRNI